MGELAAEEVGEYFGVAVRVGGEAVERGDPVFVEDAEGAEGFEARVVVGGEGEGVVGVEPAVVSVAARGGPARGYFEGGHGGFCGCGGGSGCCGHGLSLACLVCCDGGVVFGGFGDA